jgi:hypothetical protein
MPWQRIGLAAVSLVTGYLLIWGTVAAAGGAVLPYPVLAAWAGVLAALTRWHLGRR